jgi:hypothetical protein
MAYVYLKSKYYLFQIDWQWILASFFMRFSGSLSILGSAVIIYMILSDRRVKLKRIHNRILLGMSSLEILNSSAWVMSVSAVPKGTVGSFGARGNQFTCELQGFMLQFGLGVPFYNLSLCLYHYLVITRNISDSKISKRVEPFMHAVPLLFSVVTAIAGIPLELYNFNGAICYIMASPWLCTYNPFVPCIRNRHYTKFLLGFAGVWLFVIGSLIVVLMVLIYCAVRNRQRSMSRFNFRTRDGTVVESSSYIQLCRDKRETGIQAFFYISAFYLTYSWTILNSFFGDQTPDALNLLIFFFQPLQGFWNFFIYIRPRYLLISNTYPEKSVWHKLIIVVFYPEAGRRVSTTGRVGNPRRLSHSNAPQLAASPTYMNRQRITQDARLVQRMDEESMQTVTENPSVNDPVILHTVDAVKATDLGMSEEDVSQYTESAAICKTTDVIAEYHHDDAVALQATDLKVNHNDQGQPADDCTISDSVEPNQIQSPLKCAF